MTMRGILPMWNSLQMPGAMKADATRMPRGIGDRVPPAQARLLRPVRERTRKAPAGDEQRDHGQCAERDADPLPNGRATDPDPDPFRPGQHPAHGKDKAEPDRGGLEHFVDRTGAVRIELVVRVPQLASGARLVREMPHLAIIVGKALN